MTERSTAIEWARMLMARGDPADTERAGSLLRQALAAARERRLPIIERDAAALLNRA